VETQLASPNQALPTGTITFLFTDIEGSTPLWERDPGAMRAAVARHHAILHAAAEGHDGHVFKIVGDEFQISFPMPAQALQAALAAQRALRDAPWGAGGPLKVRMGLHTGPAGLVNGVLNTRDYAVSHTLNRVARIRSAGHGGQVLLSLATAELLRGHLPPDVTLTDLGLHYLKGLAQPEHIFQVNVPDLPTSFPALTSISRPHHNLPVQLTSFVGREREIAQIKDLLAERRLVTLTGSGGTGKTRLALQAATQMLETYADGVWLVELAQLADPALVPQAVGTALSLREVPGRTMLAVLSDHLREKHLLLLLDNCEHLLEACAQLADALLHACPRLAILASSREALGVAGEAPMRVPSLALTDPGQSPSLDQLSRCEALQLFSERAATALPGFTLTPDNARGVVQICQRLDGIPLAIELAATRVSVLRIEQIATRLDDRFRLLTGGSRTALPRQQTLRASIDWSYSLLALPEKALLGRLSVFAGGWTLEAAEAVCTCEGVDTADVLDLLSRLVDKSLVVANRRVGHESRYRLLETVRQYSREKLLDAGEGAAARDQHLAYYLHLSEAAEPELRGPRQPDWLRRLAIELDNLRAALEWALAGDVQAGLRLAAALWRFWHIRGLQQEGSAWLRRLLSTGGRERDAGALPPQDRLVRAQALLADAFLGSWWRTSPEALVESLELAQSVEPDGQLTAARARVYLASMYEYSDPARARELIETGLGTFRALGEPFYVADTLSWLSMLELEQGNFDAARAHVKESLAWQSQGGDPDLYAWVLFLSAIPAFARRDYAQARSWIAQSLAAFQQVEGRSLRGYVLRYLGLIAWSEGDRTLAERQFEEIQATSGEAGDTRVRVVALYDLAGLAQAEGDYALAEQRYAQALDVARAGNDQLVLPVILFSLGEIARAQNTYPQAVRNYEEALAAASEIRFLHAASLIMSLVVASLARCGLGQVAALTGAATQARSHYQAALRIWVEGRDRYGLVYVAEILKRLAAGGAPYERAVWLAGAAAAIEAALPFAPSWFGFSPIHLERTDLEPVLAAARAALGTAAFDAAWAQGQALTLEQALAAGLAWCQQEI
jgi:predicted ATPase/class 3 adenylate cyclase